MPEFRPDGELFDFDVSGYTSWSRETADRLLAEQPELYRNHLEIARWLEGWAERSPEAPEEWMEGHGHALHDIAAHLRQGDFVPGRAVYEGDDPAS